MSTFYLIRHATNDLVGHTLAGWTPGVHLNAEGQKQARTLAERLSHVRFNRIISSPLERAQETAFSLAKSQGLKIETEPAFGEVHCGDWTGKTMKELSSDPQWIQWNAFRSAARIPNGETMLEVQSRAVEAIMRLHEQFPNETIAIVSHGDVIRAIILHFLGMPLDFIHRIEITPASWSILRLYEQAAQIVAVNITP